MCARLDPLDPDVIEKTPKDQTRNPKTKNEIRLPSMKQTFNKNLTSNYSS